MLACSPTNTAIPGAASITKKTTTKKHPDSKPKKAIFRSLLHLNDTYIDFAFRFTNILKTNANLVVQNMGGKKETIKHVTSCLADVSLCVRCVTVSTKSFSCLLLVERAKIPP